MLEVYAKDSLDDLFIVIDKWNQEGIQSVTISLEDLTLMKNHIEDLDECDYLNNGDIELCL